MIIQRNGMTTPPATHHPNMTCMTSISVDPKTFSFHGTVSGSQRGRYHTVPSCDVHTTNPGMGGGL